MSSLLSHLLQILPPFRNILKALPASSRQLIIVNYLPYPFSPFSYRTSFFVCLHARTLFNCQSVSLSVDLFVWFTFMSTLGYWLWLLHSAANAVLTSHERNRRQGHHVVIDLKLNLQHAVASGCYTGGGSGHTCMVSDQHRVQNGWNSSSDHESEHHLRLRRR